MIGAPPATSVSVSVANGASPTPPATIHASVGASDWIERAAEWAQTRDDVALDCIEQDAGGHPDAFAEQRQPDHGGFVPSSDVGPGDSRSTSNTENGLRRSGSEPRPGLTITNCPGAVVGGDIWSGERDDVVVGGEARVGNDPCLDIDGHSSEYTRFRGARVRQALRTFAPFCRIIVANSLTAVL